MKSTPARKSPTGKFQGSINGEWRRLSLPAMLIGETVIEILQASQFAKEVVSFAAMLPKTKTTDPKTPDTIHRDKKLRCENTGLRIRRMKEKNGVLKTMRTESESPKLTRARSRIRFKSTSPLKLQRNALSVLEAPMVGIRHPSLVSGVQPACKKNDTIISIKHKLAWFTSGYIGGS